MASGTGLGQRECLFRSSRPLTVGLGKMDQSTFVLSTGRIQTWSSLGRRTMTMNEHSSDSEALQTVPLVCEVSSGMKIRNVCNDTQAGAF